MSGEPLTTEDEPGAAAGGDGTILVPIARLRGADSPRLAGLDEGHARLLAESDADLPPILVHQSSMRVIDGMHRLRAAQLRQRTSIRVRYFDGDDDSAFLRGVTENIRHGLPLTLADRRSAATRLLEMHPHWSDRAVGRAAGLSGKTVSALRHANTKITRAAHRLGQDGRVRPINSAVGRQYASELLARHPDASLRRIAAMAGISATTVRDVRDRMDRGEDPTTAVRRAAAPPKLGSPDLPPAEAEPDTAAVLGDLRADPALQYSETGRVLLRWFQVQFPIDHTDDFVAALPAHCLRTVARLARRYAAYWRSFADRVEGRASEEST
jgi:ParB-like chromosome segregation protein Spo0J